MPTLDKVSLDIQVVLGTTSMPELVSAVTPSVCAWRLSCSNASTCADDTGAGAVLSPQLARITQQPDSQATRSTELARMDRHLC